MVLRVLSLFCGCGGLDYGFHNNAAFEVVKSYDAMQHAVDTYNMNYPGIAEARDVQELLDPEYSLGFQPDVIIGGPPCQDFSSAGKKTLGDRANLTQTYVDIVCKYKPVFFVMENVPNIKTVGKPIFDAIVAQLRHASYGITLRIIYMPDYGIPQKRKRLIMIGMLHGRDEMFETPLFESRCPVSSMQEYIERTGIDLGFQGKKHIYRHPRTYATRGVFSVNELYPTVRGSICKLPAGYRFHPADTVHDREAILSPDWKVVANIQTFPTTYRFIDGCNHANALIIGNAVPPMFSKVLANAIAETHANTMSLLGDGREGVS